MENELIPTHVADEARLAYCALSRAILLALLTALTMVFRRLAFPFTSAEGVVAVVIAGVGQRKLKEFLGRLFPVD